MKFEPFFRTDELTKAEKIKANIDNTIIVKIF